MSFLKRIIFLLLSILFFSCQTQLEKQGWQRTAIVSESGASTINKKDKELIVVKIKHENFSEKDSAGKIINKPFLVKGKSSYAYWFTIFNKDSNNKIINRDFGWGFDNLNSDIAYYKWESDSVCLIKLLNHGNVQASFKFSFNDSSASSQILDGPKK